ncbi:prepilin-type N-terminal cleavage/methylation domain-containing protein [Pseudoduganella sp. FT26W]|uniref:Prepilin-type N-terminal cleavage/methylation domain-containing protein n=1 Tax=Duganella aquatilis TaxID=2666082 RepID=A0A844CYN4_9BURK|nr:prepilin-type N-terminal cleavage/methylation domain-containing protein [Duganella aquatilis]MRW83851.1 prepilin-type N-terminal cleavage/methylation domain-containing protein [Duganella aquatilis]
MLAGGVASRQRADGFTIVELVTVIAVIGILGAIGMSRFFDNTVFENQAYADQARSLIRYAQKLAVAQNRMIFVRSDGNSFAVCSDAACSANGIIAAPGGNNNGSAATKLNCLQGNVYAAQWMCVGRPSSVVVSAGSTRPELAAGGFFSFDAMGRPYNRDGTAMTATLPNASVVNVPAMTLTFTSGGNTARLAIWPDTGYVQSVAQ